VNPCAVSRDRRDGVTVGAGLAWKLGVIAGRDVKVAPESEV
jgi:hypothetical protein